jgi:hypothetical protein
MEDLKKDGTRMWSLNRPYCLHHEGEKTSVRLMGEDIGIY